jgi:hypothetical protein
MSYTFEKKIKEGLHKYITEIEVTPSEKVIKNICDSEKFCSAQGKITFGQLKALVESGTKKRLYKHVGEGGYKATLRLLPWFIPQLSIAGFTGSIIRAANKILKPTLEETTNYKTWWGKVIMKAFDLAEGELGMADPLTKIFFISDGLLTLMDDKYKVRFAKYIADLASEMPDDQEVPEYFVENELRKWINTKFLLNPPLPPKTTENDDQEDILIDDQISETFMGLSKKTLVEGYKYDSIIRQIVKDITTIYKSESEGEFYLPEDINDEDYEYYLKNVSVAVELILEKSNDVDGFMLNANYYSDDDVIVVKIVYNPDNKVKSTYKLIGELNELISHELRHNYQKNTGMYKLGGDTDELTGYEYYTQEHELDAQYEGFKRMSKITRKPFELLVKDWFANNKDIHQMSDEESKLVVDKILKFRP